MSFYETIEASFKLCIRFLSNLCKNDLNNVLGRNLFSIANDCSVNLSDLSKMLVTRLLGRFAPIFYLNCEHVLFCVHFKTKKKISRI